MWKAQKARFPHSHNHYCYCRFFSFLKHNFSFTPPNLDRLTVGVDLGDQWSHYCIGTCQESCVGGIHAAASKRD